MENVHVDVEMTQQEERVVHFVENKTWEEYIKEHPDIGIITIAWMHQQNSHLLGFAVRALLIAVVCAQMVIPITVFGIYFADFDNGWCPSSATAARRTLAFGIGTIYFSKLAFLAVRKFIESDSSTVLTETYDGGMIQIPICMDRVMSIAYEPAVYLLNLWIVFITEDELEMVLNALAMEFILKLDEELKQHYLSIFEPDTLAFRNENNESGTRKVMSWMMHLIVVSQIICILILGLSVVAAFAAWIYLPLCKV